MAIDHDRFTEHDPNGRVLLGEKWNPLSFGVSIEVLLRFSWLLFNSLTAGAEPFAFDVHVNLA